MSRSTNASKGTPDDDEGRLDDVTDESVEANDQDEPGREALADEDDRTAASDDDLASEAVEDESDDESDDKATGASKPKA